MAGALATRVVVADDSPMMRRILTDSLGGAGVDVVGTAADGDAALELCRRLRPDAMTLDLAMPGMDGIGVLQRLRDRGAPVVPVVVVSAFSPAHGARALDALAEGAFDLVAKPCAETSLESFTTELLEKLQAAADARPVVAGGPSRRFPAAAPASDRVLAIVSSTGGPRALSVVLPQLPAPLGAGTIVVQHMPAGFTTSLARRLDRASRLRVREARAGDVLEPGTVLLAPGGGHLRLDAGHARLSDDDPVGGLRPRADLTLTDLAERFGPRLLLVVLTGMGADGTDGARAVRQHGGRVLAEDESTCAVFGMPRSVIEHDLADRVVPLQDMAAAILEELAA